MFLSAIYIYVGLNIYILHQFISILSPCFVPSKPAGLLELVLFFQVMDLGIKTAGWPTAYQSVFGLKDGGEIRGPIPSRSRVDGLMGFSSPGGELSFFSMYVER